MAEVKEKLLCFHCGEKCDDNFIAIDKKLFCCEGCKLVYEILQENNLCKYYTLNSTPGSKQKNSIPGNRFAFLDDTAIQQKLISFRDNQNSYITFHIPSMHCSSCIWLLENMQHINKGVIISRVDFLKKELSLVFDNNQASLREIVVQLTHVGYEPSIHLDSIEKKEKKKFDNSRLYRIGVAGFCFGNIMLLSLPEYFSGGNISEPELKMFFSYLNLLLALPVFFFSASEFFINAWRGIRQKSVSIDVPIALGILAMFLRSSYEIVSHTGAGYFDSLTGLVFFMLVGRKFQDYTFDAFSFDRDYKSYFPLAVNVIKSGIEKATQVYDLNINDRIVIRNNEIIPVDGILLKGNGNIDYSFVTGESTVHEKKAGEQIFAGGKHSGSIIELQVTKEISQSQLTQLWNKNISTTKENNFQKLVKIISRWFIVTTLLIALIAGVYWIKADVHRAINAFTAVLVIACPCALALSAPFTYGNILRILGKKKIYFKNSQSVEILADVDTVVFDKTGTLTVNDSTEVTFTGDELTPHERELIFSLANQSSHRLSRQLCKLFKDIKSLPVQSFKEFTGSGLTGTIDGSFVKAGKAAFAGANMLAKNFSFTAARVYISIDENVKGFFSFQNKYRENLQQLVNRLQKANYTLVVLSGDNNSEQEKLKEIFGDKATLLFDQSPVGKLNYIKSLQQQGKKVLMVGDGLNDAGALLQSDAGISVSDDVNNFSPASDGILDATQFARIPSLLKYSKSAITIIIWSFIISVGYNFVGLSFAVQGTLSPVIAAILMPISTVSLVLFTVVSSSLRGRRLLGDS